MHARLKGINTVKKKLKDGTLRVHYYHRASGTPLEGKPGTAKFIASLVAAEAKNKTRAKGTLSEILRLFEKTAKWRRLRASTQTEYRRIFKFWDEKFGSVPLTALASKVFRKRVLEWHDEFSAEKPREADNRVTVLARVLSWAAKDGELSENVLESFDRAYAGDRSEKIWLPEHVDAFMAVADDEMRLALSLALHTGQRQADILKMAWSQYDGTHVSVRQEKTGRFVRVACTSALRATLDAAERRGLLILLTKTSLAFKKRYFSEKWEATYNSAKLPGYADSEAEIVADKSIRLHFHDLRGTAVTMLFQAGCSVAEVASISGHTLRRAQEILDKYLSRTSTMADSAIAKLEAGMVKGIRE